MNHLLATSFALCLLGASSVAQAASVAPTFVNVGTNTTTADSTTLLRADLTGLGLTQIGSVQINDSNSGLGGSPGAFSGFDLDAIFLDIDGDASTLGDQAYASSFIFTGGTLRPDPGGTFTSDTAGPLQGSASINSVDEAFSTLNAVDAIFFGTGSLTLGDGGVLTAIFSPEFLLGPSLFLFVGEVGTGIGEDITGLIKVSETSVVPLPPAFLLLLSALGIGGLMGRKRRTA
jgi:hypothetical protein